MRKKHLAACKRIALVASGLAALAGLGFAPEAFALNGEITHLSGAVVARRSDGGSRILSTRSAVNEGDLLVTAENSYARIKWADGGEVVLRPNSQLKIDTYSYDERQPQSDGVVMSLLKGGLRSVSGLLGRRNPSSFRLATPNATIGIRGTNFGALVCNNDCQAIVGNPANGLHVDVADGTVVIATAVGTISAGVGEFVHAPSINLPPVQVPPQQGIRVTLPPQAVAANQVGGVGRSSSLECAF